LGKKAEAKKTLLEVYEVGFKEVMEMSDFGFGNPSPFYEIQFVQKALVPMLDSKENMLIDSKMQKMKNHISNLPSSNIQT
jgi:hypothetical protein